MKYPSLFSTPFSPLFSPLLSGLCLLLSFFLASGAQAQLYKWVGLDGKVNYSDTPPPADAKKVETKSISGGAPNLNLPADLAAAVAQNPVVLYTAPSCNPCNEGRTLLKQLGIPFSEKTINSNEDIDKLKQVSGDTQLPLLTINKSKFRGFDGAEWRVALSSAGYPESNKLPKDYRFPPAEAAAPAPPPVKKEPTQASAPPKPKPVPEPSFHF